MKAVLEENRFPNDLEKETYDRLMTEIFLRQGFIPNHERLMGHFPLYLDKHAEVMKIVFDNDLSISSVWRYYIAYMASATHKCKYLMNLVEYLCRLHHQDWFTDTTEVPEKLQALSSANVKLAHRPWEFSERDIRKLLIYWNANELVLALTILCQFHCLSCFIFGVGISSEKDIAGRVLKDPTSPLLKASKPKTNLVAILKGYSESTECDEYISDSSEDILLEGEEDLYFSRIAGDYLSYINYPMDSFPRSFNASDFRFSDQAYYVLEKMVPEVSESIWNRIRMTFAMTYDNLGSDSGIETGPLRRAIWNYVQRVYGLQYDDYRYTDINKFLKLNTKRYIKKTACFPESVKKQDYRSIELDITNDEMIHINLMICEARFEAQLVYMLHAVQGVFGLL